ncbi:MAG TPA: hypothetical protein VE863_07080 [Pyrinomonadaceae bacterium]|jgi:hypothetical protein|nr:hypothetical protein [Pyrinomonadaceae bacterium]
MAKSSQAKVNRKVPSPSPRKAIRTSKASGHEDKYDARDARLALKEAGAKGSISWEKLKKELGL